MAVQLFFGTVNAAAAKVEGWLLRLAAAEGAAGSRNPAVVPA